MATHCQERDGSECRAVALCTLRRLPANFKMLTEIRIRRLQPQGSNLGDQVKPASEHPAAMVHAPASGQVVQEFGMGQKEAGQAKVSLFLAHGSHRLEVLSGAGYAGIRRQAELNSRAGLRVFWAFDQAEEVLSLHPEAYDLYDTHGKAEKSLRVLLK